MPTKFFHLDGDKRTPLAKPEDVKRFLAKSYHWKTGYSAAELAKSWIKAQDFPPPVRRVIETCADYRGIRLIEGYFERKTDLRTPGRDSQTDLLLIGETDAGPVVVGVEGKRDEVFGPIIRDWLAKGGRRQERLEGLCRVLGLDPGKCHPLRYQLFHRTVAAVFEAEAVGAKHAMLLVHSFSTGNSGFNDFRRFTGELGIPLTVKNSVSGSKALNNMAFRFAWVSDPRPL
jgi:hypothetical protein